MKQQLVDLLVTILVEMGIPDFSPEVEIPENPTHGEYTTNVAMKIATSAKFKVQSSKWKSPMELALQASEYIKYQISHIKKGRPDQNTSIYYHPISPLSPLFPLLQAIDRVEVAPPGFINFFLTEATLSSQLQTVLDKKEAYGTASSIPSDPSRPSPRIMVEFAHPNTHKAFHIGHLRNITTGESVVRLLTATGHDVIRANYQGDVGMHIAKCLYGILHSPQYPLSPQTPLSSRVEFLGKAYAAGSASFEEDEGAKKEIGEINKKIYTKDPSVYPVYEVSRQWSLDYFEAIYKRLGTHYDRYYFESEVYASGKALVLEGLKKGIFEKSEGAIIFPGEKYGLHNRVFLSGEGNTTYEGKDMGLGQLQFNQYHPDKIIHVVGPEQTGYFQVVFEALARLFPETRGKEYHLAYGWVRLKKGKMSSRSGNVVTGEWLLDSLKQKIYNILDKNMSSPVSPQLPQYPQSEKDSIAEAAAVAAVKYSFLRVGTTQEIAFDLDESVSLEGDSGPYLLYTYARCKSVLRKAGLPPDFPYSPDSPDSMNTEERAVSRLITHFPDVVADAAESLAPSSLCTYLNRLASSCNLFYAKHHILSPDIPYSPDVPNLRISLTAATAQVLQNGLHLLGIQTVERM